MKICKSCEMPMKNENWICTFCGYDPKTDTISPNFNQQLDSTKDSKQKARLREKKSEGGAGIDPKVKIFAFIGLVVVAFSLLYKHNFRITGVSSEITHFFSRFKTGKFAIGAFGRKEDKTGKTEKKAELIDMGSFQAPQDTMEKKDLVVEGISFDPGHKSFAIINGKVLSEGEYLGSIVIKKINKDSVEVVVDGLSKVLRVESTPLSAKDR